MANQTITLGKDVNSINWVNAGTSYPVEELFLDGTLIWPDPNWAKSITLKNFRYRSSASFGSALNYLPSDFNNSGWDKRGGGEPFPILSDYNLYSRNYTARGRKDKGCQVHLYNTLDSSITPMYTASDINSTHSFGTGTWSIKGGLIPANHIPFTYGGTKGRAGNYMTGENPKGDNVTFSQEKKGVNGTYLPVFYRMRGSSDSISTKSKARDAFIYTFRKLRVSNRRPSSSGFYFTDKKLSQNDLFTGIYTNSSSPGTNIILGVYYKDFSEPGLSPGNDFRFEVRTLLHQGEYRFGTTSTSSMSKRRNLFKKNVYYDNTLSHPGLPDINNVKTVNLGRFGPPVLWTTDSFPDANNNFYGPIESSFTWEIPIDQRPMYNELFKWREEGDDWSLDSVKKTYWNESWSIDNHPYKNHPDFETEELIITAEQA